MDMKKVGTTNHSVVTNEQERKKRYIKDFVSGKEVKATPEELDAVQVFSRRLVEVYGYDKKQVQTRPQWRVRKSPSEGKSKSYPIDIAVFANEDKIEDNLYMVVECKQRVKKKGIQQLKIYMQMSAARIGVWFNGEGHHYILKHVHPDGSLTWEVLPDIPRKGQRSEDVGLFKRKQLIPAEDLKSVFRDLRNYLAGNVRGITRDEPLAHELINVLFCKIYDEKNKGPEETVDFRASYNENRNEVEKRILGIFKRVKNTYSDIFDSSDQITLDPDSIVYVVGELQKYSITDAKRDAIGNAFETFIGPALKGAQGQFFTPRNVVHLAVDVLDPQPEEMIIDPACGSGGFLIVALEHIWKNIETRQEEKGWSDVDLALRRRDIAADYIRGIDKDSFLAKVSKAYMALVGDGRGGIFCENALYYPSKWHPAMTSKISLEKYDVLFTNPPFGTKIRIEDQEILRQFDLGHDWNFNKESGEWDKGNVSESQTPQLLFIERCHQFLKNGGRMAIMLPESIFGMPKYRYIVNFVLKRFKVIAFISLPEELFQPNTHAKTCLVCLEKCDPPEDYDVFMGIAKWCGHDSMGRLTLRKLPGEQEELLDDIPKISELYSKIIRNGQDIHSRLGFVIRQSDMINDILIPKYYDPTIIQDLEKLRKDYDLFLLGELESDGTISFSTGDEIGKLAYGTGNIPFIRTSDISNWELKIDPKQRVSEEIYNQYCDKQDVQAEDIFVVRDGTYLVGTSCILTEDDTKILYCGGIYKIRVENRERIDPYLLLVLLNTPIVKRQIRSKQFTRDVIDTLGKRINEIVIPIPKNEELKSEISRRTKELIMRKKRLRNETKRIVHRVLGDKIKREEDDIDLV